MTVIAWDGKTLAADRQCTMAGMRITVRKISRLSDGRLVGIAGNASAAQILMDWIASGGDKPEKLQHDETWPGGIEIGTDGRIWRHEQYGKYEVLDKRFAIGVGADAAMAAMICGKTAAEAVEVANSFVSGCGMGIDTLEIERVSLAEAAD